MDLGDNARVFEGGMFGHINVDLKLWQDILSDLKTFVENLVENIHSYVPITENRRTGERELA